MAINKTTQPKNSKSISDFLDNCTNDCQKWFEASEYKPGKSTTKTANNYISQFGLERGSKNFPLLADLKTAIVHYFQTCQIKCDESNITVRANIFDILSDIYQASDLQKGQKVLFTLPISSYFAQQCYDAEIEVEFLNTDSSNNWKIDSAILSALLKKHPIKILFLNYPCTITGAVLKKSEAENIAKIIAQHPDLLVIIDESMREMIMDCGVQSFSLATFDNISNQIITISSLQHNNLAHLDITFACIKNKAIAAKTHRSSVNIATSNQHIAISALQHSEANQKHLAEIIEECHQNAKLVTEELKNINDSLKNIFGKSSDDFAKPFLQNQPISSSMLLQFSGLKGAKTEENKILKSDLDLAEFLKQKTDIALLPGQFCFLPEEEMILKLYLLRSKQELKTGFKKINQAILKLKMLSKTISKASVAHLLEDIKNHSH